MELTQRDARPAVAPNPGLEQVRRLLRAVANALAEGGASDAVLQRCCQALVDHLGAAFARIWTLEAGAEVLRLRASAGIYTRLNGRFAEVPLGGLKIGQIASERKEHLTNDVPHDPRILDPGWAAAEGMVAFAGHPLVVEGRVLGVMALFARHALPPEVNDELAFVAGIVAQFLDREGAAANERRRIAQELHDTVSQGLYATSLEAQAALRSGDVPPGLRATLDRILEQTANSQRELREVMLRVQPEGLEAGGLGAALEQLAATVAARHRVQVDTDIAAEPDLADDARQAVYRIAQEALSNSGRHAHARRVRLTLEDAGEGRHLLTVEDDGDGFAPSTVRAGHYGLRVMRERAAERGWDLDVRSRPEEGTRVTLAFAAGSERP